MDKKMTFDVFKNIIIEENKKLIKQIAITFNKDEQYLLDKYITPTYYLPIISKK
jgi:iron uptake system EfeUOB component EfeO/EfeM